NDTPLAAKNEPTSYQLGPFLHCQSNNRRRPSASKQSPFLPPTAGIGRVRAIIRGCVGVSDLCTLGTLAWARFEAVLGRFPDSSSGSLFQSEIEYSFPRLLLPGRRHD